MIFVGIDNSLQSPGLTIYDKQDELYYFYFLTQRKRETGIKVTTDKYVLEGIDYPEWKTREERIDKVTQILIDKIDQFPTLDKNIMIEGYAFSAQSRSVTHLAEIGGVLRNKLYKLNLLYDEIPPTVIKKFFTGKGNSNKNGMYLQYKNYIRDWQVPNLFKEIGINPKSKKTNPVDDIIDSFAIVCYNMGIKIQETDIVGNILKGLK